MIKNPNRFEFSTTTIHNQSQTYFAEVSFLEKMQSFVNQLTCFPANRLDHFQSQLK